MLEESHVDVNEKSPEVPAALRSCISWPAALSSFQKRLLNGH
jgi:hypothetical protein